MKKWQKWVIGVVGAILLLMVSVVVYVALASRRIPINATFARGDCQYTIAGWIDVDISVLGGVTVNRYSLTLTSSNPRKCGEGKAEVPCGK